MPVTFQAIHEDRAGARWGALFRAFWPAYRSWFFGEGTDDRPPRVVAESRLKQEMPELMPTYRRLLDLAGGGADEARFLSLYRPAPYLTGCSQAVWTGDEPVLVRNYDYSPRLWEGVLLSTTWNGRRVMAMSDCLWGVLDGLNEAGLAVSLSFGGRKAVGDGFGCPLILRYVLEICSTTREAMKALTRVPTHMAYNITVVDARGDFATAYLSPDRAPQIRRWPLATNHQEEGGWKRYIEKTSSIERERFLAERLGDPRETLEDFTQAFLSKPLYARDYGAASGTLYTAAYYPARRTMELRWPGRTATFPLDGFEETTFPLDLSPDDPGDAGGITPPTVAS